MGYDSANIPKLFKTVRWRSYSVNLDVGGGHHEDATLYLAERKVKNIIYDPDHKSAVHNAKAINLVINMGGSHSVTLSNVLNVIPSWKDRDAVLYYCKFLARSGSPLYVGVCEGDKSGVGKMTSKGWQANLQLSEYEKAISNRFEIVEVKDDIITALKYP